MTVLRAAMLLAIAGPEAPGAFRIFRAGVNDTEKGLFAFTAESATAVLAAAAKWGVRLSIDYGHAMLDSWPMIPAESGKSAGSFLLEARDGELWAVDVKWTPAAKAAIEAREWLYISPAFDHAPDGTITGLLNVALTNIPAMRGLDPLIALARTLGFKPDTAKDSGPMKTVLALLALSDTATEGEARAAIEALRAPVTELLSVTGKGTPGEALGVARAGVEALARVTELRAELDKRRVEALGVEVEAAIRCGKVPPALRTWALDYGARDAAGFAAYLSAAVPLLSVNGAPPPPPAAPGAPVLSADELAVCSQLGVKPEAFASARASG